MAGKRQVTYSSRPNRAARQAHRQGAREFKTYDTSFIRPKSNFNPTIMALGLAALALLLLFAAFSCSRGCNRHAMLDAGTPTTLTVPDGATTTDIAQMLYDGGLIEDTGAFTAVVQQQGADAALKPGTYDLVGGTSLEDLVATLHAGPKVTSFTIPEGYTIDRMAQAVEEAYGGSITADQFRQAAHDADAYAQDFPFVKEAYEKSLEGFLFPKTYPIEEGDTAESVVRKMLSQYQQETASLDFSKAEQAGLGSYDALILASVVEREAAEDNRATVASVFYNRLNINMPLQSDATIAYLVNRDPTPEDLDTESPYNTYLNYGLPAGPICSPSLASLEAVCNPETTDYLYFYFWPDESGVMQYAFSQTYEEHQNAIGGTNTLEG